MFSSLRKAVGCFYCAIVLLNTNSALLYQLLLTVWIDMD